MQARPLRLLFSSSSGWGSCRTLHIRKYQPPSPSSLYSPVSPVASQEQRGTNLLPQNILLGGRAGGGWPASRRVAKEPAAAAHAAAPRAGPQRAPQEALVGSSCLGEDTAWAYLKCCGASQRCIQMQDWSLRAYTRCIQGSSRVYHSDRGVSWAPDAPNARRIQPPQTIAGEHAALQLKGQGTEPTKYEEVSRILNPNAVWNPFRRRADGS